MIEKKKIEVEVSKEAYELMEGLHGMVKSIQEALADGWQAGQDIPKIVMDSISILMPAVDGADKIPAEAKEELEAFVSGVMLKSKDIGFMFYEKKEEAPAE